MPDAILSENSHRLAIDLQVSRDQLAVTPGLHVGPLLTVAKPILSADQKRQLGEQYQALAVDMETLAVAEICRQEKQRFLAVRVVSDAVDEELPADIER